MKTSVLFQIQSFLILSLLFIGTWLIAKKRNRDLHVKTMLTAIIWDVLLILQIELSRGAIAKASKAITNPYILNIHGSLALTTTILYVALVVMGRKILKGDYGILKLHKKLGILALIMRTLTFVTSFYAVIE